MSLTLRRTPAADPARDAELPHTLDVEALHALLHERGEADLAAALVLRLTPEEARDLADLLAQFRRQCGRPGLFKSYRRLLDTAGALQVDLAVAFLRGASHAGCRVYANPGTDVATIPHTAPPQQLYLLPLSDSQEDSIALGAENDGSERHGRIMPAWLPAPHGSPWDR